MLTIFATPKPFKGHFNIIQRNAIMSWKMLSVKPEIILFGNEEGTAAICREFNLIHRPNVQCTFSGAPLLNEVFSEAQRLAVNNLLCYVNSDIILLSDFVRALNVVNGKMDKFLMVGRIWRCYIEHELDFKKPDWEEKIRSYVLANGAQAPPPGNSDFFLFPKNAFQFGLSVGIGRGFWEAWLVYNARNSGGAVIDASFSMMPIHQNHDQSTYIYGLKKLKEEINRNHKMVGKGIKFSLLDATHVLVNNQLKHPFGVSYFVQACKNLPILKPKLSFLVFIPIALINIVRGVKEFYRRVSSPLYRLRLLVLSKFPACGVTLVCGLSGEASKDENKPSGLLLAKLLLLGGYPVIGYDTNSSVIEKAKKELGGPVEFTSSLQNVINEVDVIVNFANSLDDLGSLLSTSNHDLQNKTFINCSNNELEVLKQKFNYFLFKC